MTTFTMMPFAVNNNNLPKIAAENIELLVDSEPNALAHWLFQNNTNHLNDLISNRKITPVNGAITTSKGVLVQGDENTSSVKTFKTDLIETPNSTMIVVFKTPLEQDWTGNSLSLCGAFAGSSAGPLCYLNKTSIKYFMPPLNQISGDLTEPLEYNTWYVAAFSNAQLENGTGNVKLLLGGKNLFDINYEARDSISSKNIELGMSYNFSASYSTAPVEIAEFIYFEEALSVNEINSVIGRTAIRMAEKGITLGL